MLQADLNKFHFEFLINSVQTLNKWHATFVFSYDYSTVDSCRRIVGSICPISDIRMRKVKFRIGFHWNEPTNIVYPTTTKFRSDPSLYSTSYDNQWC